MFHFPSTTPTNVIMETDQTGSSPGLLALPPEIFLQICSELHSEALARLSATHKGYRWLQTNALKYDAVHEQKALLTAAWKGYDDHHAIRLLTASLHFGADINKLYQEPKYGGAATALHLAAAVGKIRVADALIKLGADIRARGHHICAFLGNERLRSQYIDEFRKTNFDFGIDHLPLAIPFVLGHEDTVESLVRRGAPADLYVPSRQPINNSRAYTIFHVMATGVDRLESLHDLFKRTYRHTIDQQSPRHGETAVAIAASNLEPFKETPLNFLISLNADLNIPSLLGKTPLMHMVDVACFTAGLTKDHCSKVQESISTLISKGANPNQFVADHAESTVMFYTLSFVSLEIESGRNMTRFLTSVVEILLTNGYDLSITSSQNITPLHYLTSLLGRYAKVEKFVGLFDLLLGADAHINRVVNGQTSILLTAFRSPFYKPKLIQKLLSHGADILDSEADILIDHLLENSKHRALGNEVLYRHRHAISQSCINLIYRSIISTNNSSEMKWLERFQLHATHLDSTIARHFMQDGMKLGSINLEQGFNVDWTNDYSESYLHLLVKKLGQDNRYHPRDAIKDAVILIERGIKVCLKDYGGKMATQRLRELGSEAKTSLLLYLLLNQKDRERDEW